MATWITSDAARLRPEGGKAPRQGIPGSWRVFESLLNRAGEDDLRPLPGLLEVTTSEGVPDVVTLEDGDHLTRAIMPCGHAISSSSMRDCCTSLLNRGKVEMDCPSCSCLWPWNLVRHVTCYSDTEWKEFEAKLENIKMAKDPNNLQCPGCERWLRKELNKRLRQLVVCSYCTRDAGRSFTFCPDCLDVTRKLPCSGCLSKTEKRKKILSSCPDVQIGSRVSPSVRACPNCHLLFHFNGGCKHVLCRKCSCNFCFVCLDFSPQGEYYCAHLAIRCGLAPRQSC